jgi:hypothetical protein
VYVNLLLAAFLTGCMTQKPNQMTQAAAPAQRTIPSAPKSPPPASSPGEAKLDQGLRELSKSVPTKQTNAGAVDQKKVKVEITANDAADIPKLKEAVVKGGGTITSDLGNHLWVSIPITSIRPLSEMDAVWTMAISHPTSTAQ